MNSVVLSKRLPLEVNGGVPDEISEKLQSIKYQEGWQFVGAGPKNTALDVVMHFITHPGHHLLLLDDQDNPLGYIHWEEDRSFRENSADGVFLAESGVSPEVFTVTPISDFVAIAFVPNSFIFTREVLNLILDFDQNSPIVSWEVDYTNTHARSIYDRFIDQHDGISIYHESWHVVHYFLGQLIHQRERPISTRYYPFQE